VRCELPSPNAAAAFAPFEGHPLLGLISLMDHTPGQRQWSDIEIARRHYTERNGWSNERFELELERAPRLQQTHARSHRRFFADYASSRGIPLASHDDALASDIAQAHRDGVTIAEFPTRLAAAREARALGLHVVMGAPNVVCGGSHAGNVSAVALARERLLDALSSDYVPASLLLAAFRLSRDAGLPLPQAVAAVSCVPARAAGLSDRGEIAPGLRADLVQVRIAANGAGSHPVVRAVWRGGERVA
jgi:alpha-D-ribose 1-methylphosphonate 5-triphosphate diphosphatase